MTWYPKIHGLFTSNDIGTISNSDKFGYLYNWFAINNVSEITPIGWHVPTYDEWLTVLKKVDSNASIDSTTGGKLLKEINYTYWLNDGSHIGTNTIGFNGRGGNKRLNTGVFYESNDGVTGKTARWWTSSWDGDHNNSYEVQYNTDSFVREHTDHRRYGGSVRCISDTTYPNPTRQVLDIDGNSYNTIYINGQEWITTNLKTTKYADGSPITNYLSDDEDLITSCFWVNSSTDPFNVFIDDGLDITEASTDSFGYTIGSCYLETNTPTVSPTTLRITLTLDMYDSTTPPRLIVLDEDLVEWYNQELVNYTNNIDITVTGSVGKFTIWLYNQDDFLTTQYYTNFRLTNLKSYGIGGWQIDTTGAYCWYNNNISNKNTYGALYNWYAVNNVSNLAHLEYNSVMESGWRVATIDDYTKLRSYLGTTNAGGKLKEVGTTHWSSPNNGATNQYGFTALPGGYRGVYGVFTSINVHGFWWTSNEYNSNNSYYLDIHNDTTVMDLPQFSKRSGYSVRLVRDTYPNVTFPQMEDYDGNLYNTVLIGEKLWTASNLKVIHYNNGNNIHYIGNKKDWFLPSSDELYLMYINLKLNNIGNFSTGKYWSSTEASATQAYVRNFNTGVSEIISKSIKSGTCVRPVRIFNSTISYDIGSYGYHNGYIFNKTSNDDGTFEYYECYIEDTYVGSVGWSNIVNVECGNTLPHIGTGFANTYLISHQVGHTSSAANKCELEDENYRWSQDVDGANCTYNDDISYDMRNLPRLTTNNVTNLDYYSFTTGGYIISSGSSTITSRGICYNLTGRPTINNGYVTTVAGTLGTFINGFNGMDSGTTYYFRAFATNSYGTVYGNEVIITTLSTRIPYINTKNATNIADTTITCGGESITDGGLTITAKGVCWSSSTVNPTIVDSKTNDGTGTSDFTSSITGLSVGVTYYIRAYATNSKGTGYGDRITVATIYMAVPTLFTTVASNIFNTKISSGGYGLSENGSTITAKGVCWNTSPNPTVSNSKTIDGTDTDNFTSLLTGLISGTTYYIRAYATNTTGTGYGAQITVTTLNGRGYGYLYNQYAVQNVNNIAPLHWHVPTTAEFQTLINYAGGELTPGLKLMESGTIHWTIDVGTNDYGFSAVGTGYRINTLDYTNLKSMSFLWSSSPKFNFYDYLSISQYQMVINNNDLRYGMGIRLIMDEGASWDPGDIMIDYDGNEYDTVSISGRVWCVQNLKTTHYRNGTPISYIPDYNNWLNNTSGAYCAYDNDVNNA